MSQEIRGHCLCGDVELKVTPPNDELGVCHCQMCRRWGGGPLLAVDCGTEVAWSGWDRVKVYDSSDWADRGFCENCGTHLFYRLKGNGQYIIPAGLFGDTQFTFDHQVFIDEKPAYYHFGNQSKELTGEEVFAIFANLSDTDTQN